MDVAGCRGERTTISLCGLVPVLAHSWPLSEFSVLQPVVHLVPQLQDPDLGARIEHAMRHAFSCRHERVAIVGTDVPDLTSSLVAGALQALDSYQARMHGVRMLVARVRAKDGRAVPTYMLCNRCTRTFQAVFGPAADGGFYLLALSTLPSGLFQVLLAVLAGSISRAGRQELPPPLLTFHPRLACRASSGAHHLP